MTTDRRALIAANLRPSAAFSADASDLNDRFQEAIADAQALPEAERARLLSALLAQLSGELARLHGNR